MSNGLSAYKSVGVQSAIEDAPPHRLIQMLLDGAISKVAIARAAMERGETATKGKHISWAISIIDGLMGSLDKSKGGPVAQNLAALYGYMHQQLLSANLNNDLGKLDEVSRLLGQIREGWAGIAPEAAQRQPA
ncbi:MAG: flagellar export chaperone FliS [Gammaproteobacteria bacterium]|nr:flagellar export chaperone FliS [Gammaproteobacteria bacterium]